MAFYTAVLLAAVAFLVDGIWGKEEFLGLIAPAGVLLITTGALMTTNYRGMLDRMYLAQQRKLGFRLTGETSATRFGGALMVMVGVGWLAFGIASLIQDSPF